MFYTVKKPKKTQVFNLSFLNKCLVKKDKIHLSIPRGVEIHQWIDTNIHSDNGKNWKRKTLGVDYQYVILDDDCDMLYIQRNNFIRTNGNIGLTEENCKLAIEILNKDCSIND